MLEHLKPISGSHSISKVIATVFMPQAILKPDYLFNKISTKENFKRYARKNLNHTQTFNFNLQEKSMKNAQEVCGFTLESFNETGKLKDIFRLINNPEKGSTLTFETRIYEDWDVYYEIFERDLKSFFDDFPLIIQGVGLSYVDEFDWASEDNIDTKSIFRSESDMLNEKFLNSKNASIISLSQNEQNNDASTLEERAEISFSNSIKKIVINHHYAKGFPKLEMSNDLMNSQGFGEYFNNAHKINKDILKSLLTDSVLEMINLK